MMKRWLLLVLFSILTLNYAAAQSSQSQSQQEYNLKITGVELDLIGRALGLMSYNDVASLVQKLRQQVVEQQQLKNVEEPKK